MVKIIAFDGFKILVDGENIVNRFGITSKKAILLQYLLANLNEEILIKDIAKVLWQNDESEDSINATKMTIAQVRNELANYDLADCMLVRKDRCAWTVRKDVDIDFVTMQKTYQKAMSESMAGNKPHVLFEEILFTYAGDLFATLGNVEWIKHTRAYFNKLFCQTIKKYIDILEKEEKFIDIVRVSKLGIEKVPLEVDINIAFMKALINLNRPAEALLQYENVTNLYYIYFGGSLPNELIEFYKVLIKQEKVAQINLEQIYEDLKIEDEDEGALLCDYSIFKYIFRLYMRNLKRLNTTVFVVLVRLQAMGGNIGPIETDRAMQRLGNTLKDNLRSGDALSRQSIMAYALLLPRVNSANTCKFVMERVKQLFYMDSQNTKFTLEYKMLQLKEEE